MMCVQFDNPIPCYRVAIPVVSITCILTFHLLTHLSTTHQSTQEVRFDYETTEWNVGAFEKCLCGCVECRGHIKGYRYSGDVVHDKYDNEVIAKYLRTASGRGTS